ncbi:DUF2330 domain-containing protein [Marinagarivorans cellulosilyticus]|uniref:DUF2330 domain-containing protein n=1 Tax=Marinagarivorans cellulosilyticus TaxID=2721545 RepID=A0AAN2BLR2_9GAMM|nr:DUF2330 domain-containing protein [Marinagarivorans cellulosilyticus]BCD99408.1 hypothetical protein MARGE09_P3610 [Marinagarivorans cellulosilyticus]
MAIVFPSIKKPLSGLLLLVSFGVAQHSSACGGFFCDFVPIDQAGEQIVFRQDGDQTTAMIKIDYAGNAADFGWVLPVPQTPEISLGSDQIFTELELSTRPQFLLERVGQGCPRPAFDFASNESASSVAVSSQASSSSGVIIERQLSVGPFDALVVSSDDPEALANWLDENNLDLTDEGGSLLAPYIAAQSKFVVLKLKNNANSGSIQPIILKYQSDVPVIPMTLTAVAAQDNMGVLVWLLGDGRGVPKNFKHVTPNYTRLNWFNGPRSAYASYQNLITQAMDEAGGQGFATDFAGYLPNLPERFTTPDMWVGALEELAGLSDAGFISGFWKMGGSAVVQDTIRNALPTSNTFVYAQPLSMEELFTAEELALARVELTDTVNNQLIMPVNNAIDILDDDLYLTRLYTTLSADEMDMNPEFTFNPSMDPQQLTRNATLTSACVDNQDHWTLKLGAGTGREDELVVDSLGWGQPFGVARGASSQPAVWQVEKTSGTSDPIVLAKNDFTPLVSVGDITVPVWTSSSTSSFSSTASTSSSSLAVNSDDSVAVSSTASSTSSGIDIKSGGSMGSGFLALFGLLVLRLRNFKKMRTNAR